jgi:hypothetical protein
MVEGSLDIFWENYTTRNATPKYRLLFARYENFKSGAQQSNRLVGADALESYLVEINFTPDNAKNWVKQVNEKNSVSIPNVMMPEPFIPQGSL